MIGDDPDDRRLFRLTLCQDCTRRCSKCPTCKLNNSEASLQQLRELELVRKNIELVSNGFDKNGKRKYFVRINYPVLGDLKTLYASHLSNSDIAKCKSVSLFNKLRKLNLAEQFHLEILKGIKDGQIRILSEADQCKVLGGPHCLAGLNYSLKPDSTSQAIRPVCDSSLHHVNSSLNSRLPCGPSFIGNLRSIFTAFRLKWFALIFDLARAYRSLKSNYEAGTLRLQWYPVNPLDPATDWVLLF